ncbi:MAG: glycosyl transferase [Bacteroidales bacterium]|nr:glycosyl transferase [Bacteroidales bacterium]
MFKKVKRYLKNPYYALGDDMMRVCPKLMSDKYYIKVMWKQITGKEIDLDNPQTYNEKLQWLKLYDRNPLYTLLVDKFRVKEWVKSKIGEEYVIPLIASYESVDDIIIEELPQQFVLKCNHDSGSVIVVRNKSNFDFDEAKKKLKKALSKNFYNDFREWAYKNVKPCVIAEKYVEDVSNPTLLDCKFFCFDGEPRLLYIARDGADIPVTDFFDMDFNHLPIRMKDPNCGYEIEKPRTFNKMIELARVLADGFPHVRVDFYTFGDRIYFGEMTFYPSCGFTMVKPYEWNLKMGEWIKIPSKSC